jgi:hypothetical protein
MVAFPAAWLQRKSSSINPESAMITFLPIEDETNLTNHIGFFLGLN